jgi:hypothetical protein
MSFRHFDPNSHESWCWVFDYDLPNLPHPQDQPDRNQGWQHCFSLVCSANGATLREGWVILRPVIGHSRRHALSRAPKGQN